MHFARTLFAALSVSTYFAAPAHADKAMLVLDASGSMWGQIDGKAKIDIAREVVGGLLSDWPARTELGLVAYGHREKANCGDIQTLVTPAPNSSPAINAAIGDIDPKGKTPLTDAVRHAARELRSEEDKATVILISDGLETCEADPCAVAAELKRSGIDFTVHVVGFGTSAEENRKLRCIADNTGGRFLGASNASELKRAMSSTVDLVARPAERAEKVVAKPAVKPVEKAVEKKTTVVKVQIGWVSLKNSDRIEVFSKDGAKAGQICDGCGRLQLPPGAYKVTSAGFETDIELDAGEEKLIDGARFVGWLSLKNSDRIEIFGKGGAKAGQLCEGCGHVQLPPGAYKVTSAGFETDVEINAGDKKTIDGAQFVGWLSLKNSDSVDIFSKDGGKVGRLCAGCGRQQLAPGNYRVKSTGYEAEVEVKPGQESVIDGSG